jgi:hypothetical protein
MKRCNIYSLTEQVIMQHEQFRNFLQSQTGPAPNASLSRKKTPSCKMHAEKCNNPQIQMCAKRLKTTAPLLHQRPKPKHNHMKLILISFSCPNSSSSNSSAQALCIGLEVVPEPFKLVRCGAVFAVYNGGRSCSCDCGDESFQEGGEVVVSGIADLPDGDSYAQGEDVRIGGRGDLIAADVTAADEGVGSRNEVSNVISIWPPAPRSPNSSYSSKLFFGVCVPFVVDGVPVVFGFVSGAVVPRLSL